MSFIQWLWKGSQVPQEEDEEALTKKAIKELEIFVSQIFYNFFLFISFFQLLYFITYFLYFFYPRHLPTPTPTTHTHDPRPTTHDPRPTTSTHDPRHLATLVFVGAYSIFKVCICQQGVMQIQVQIGDTRRVFYESAWECWGFKKKKKTFCVRFRRHVLWILVYFTKTMKENM